MSGQPTLDQYARRVARALDLRVSRTRVPKKARALIHAALLRAQGGEPVDLARDVAEAARSVHPESDRPYYAALFLLEYAWMLAAGAPHARELLRLFRWYYDACREARPDLWESLRADLVERQWSSFRLVREVAATAQGSEPPTADEVGMLADELVPHESRYRVAERLLRAAQGENKGEHLPAFFEYLRRLHAAGTRTPPDAAAQEGTEALLYMLKQFGSRQVVFDHLFKAYIKFADDTNFGGRLQHLLANSAHHLIPELVKSGKKFPNYVRPIAHILEHMLVHTQDEAAGAGLAELIEAAERPSDRYKLVELLVKAGRELARRRDTPPAVIELFRQTAERYRDAPGLGVMAADLDNLPWGKELSARDVIDYLERKPNAPSLADIRACGQPEFDVIAQYARDPGQPLAVRLRATHTASEFKSKRLVQRAGDLLWELYQDAGSGQPIKAAALDGMRAIGRPISEAEKERLYADYLAAEPVLKATFDRNREWYFGHTTIVKSGSPQPPTGS